MTLRVLKLQIGLLKLPCLISVWTSFERWCLFVKLVPPELKSSESCSMKSGNKELKLYPGTLETVVTAGEGRTG